MNRFRIFLLSLASGLPGSLLALPQGAEVQVGDVSFQSHDHQMQIQQQSDRALVEYDSFSIAHDEIVQVQQPSADSVLINRVKAGGPMSELYGRLQANGQIFLLNTSGILVGADAQIDVGGLLLTSHNLSSDDLDAGAFQFMSHGITQMVQVDGDISVSPGSYVVLLAEQVEHHGSIVAQFGQVSLVSADGASVVIEQGEMPKIAIEKATYDAWIHQNGVIQANGGLVEITAASANDLIDRVIYHEGITDVSSTQIVQRGGQTFLESVPIEHNEIRISTNDTQGYIDVAGTLDASGDSTTGAANVISVRGEAIFVREDARVLNNGDQGNGGETYVVANYLVTDADSVFEARGGAEGDGGFVELSGRIDLSLEGQVTTLAPNGRAGTLLIDPRNLNINTAVTTGIAPPTVDGDDTTYQPSQNSATLAVSTILSALENGNVIVTTDDGGVGVTQAGDLTLQSDIDLDTIGVLDTDGDGQPNIHTLTLRANNDLIINADIEDKVPGNGIGGHANIVLEATSDIEMSDSTRIDAGDGQIQVITTNGDFNLEQLESAFANGVAIDINVGGSVFDVNGASDNVLLTGANGILAMNAGSEIAMLQGNVPIYRATAVNVQGFEQTVAGDLQISRARSSASSPIGFEASTLDGDIIVRGTVDETSPGIQVSDDGRLILDVGGNSDILIEDNITIEDGVTSISANNGNITMELGTILSSNGTVSLRSEGTQQISQISTTSSANNAIQLEVTGGNDIVDADDQALGNPELVNLIAPNGGLRLENVDNFAEMETNINRFSTGNVNISQIVLIESNDLIVSQIFGTSTGVDINAAGTVLVDIVDIGNGGSITITADRIGEYYTSDPDRLASVDVASIAAPSISLIATTSIGDLDNTSFAVVDAVDVETADLRIELLAEVTDDDANEIAVQQVSDSNQGNLVVSEVVTANSDSGVARVHIGSLNNSVDVSSTIFTVDSNDKLGFEVRNSDQLGIADVILPSLATVQSWIVQALSFTASATNTRIVTSEPAITPLTNLTTSISQLIWSSNTDQTLNFSGLQLDLATTDGNINVNASGALQLADLNGDGNSLVSGNGNVIVAAAGLLQVEDQISATDNVLDGTRSGLIDLTTSSGNIEIGALRDTTITSINTVDADVEAGLGTMPRNQTAIRVAQTQASGAAGLTIGSESTSVIVTAQGGDIFMASGINAVNRDPNERTLILNESVAISSYDLISDDLSAGAVLNEVTIIDQTAAEPSVETRGTRRITLSSVNIPAFSVEDEEKDGANEAVDDAERQTESDATNQQDPVVESDDENQTRLNVMLNTVVPGCESGEDEDQDCARREGFKEFLRSLVIGRGFPEKYKGLQE